MVRDRCRQWPIVLQEAAEVVNVPPGTYINSHKTPAVTIFPNFLTPEECANYREMPIPPNATRHDSDMIFQGDIVVEKQHVVKLLDVFALSAGPQQRLPFFVPRPQAFPSTQLHALHTYLKTSSKFHQDYYGEGPHKGELATRNLAFVFLNDNEHATFIHGNSDPIPAKEGTLLIFKGDVWHSTSLLGGDVHLLGPFDTEELLQTFTSGTAAPMTPAPATPAPATPEPATQAPATPAPAPATCADACQWWNIICWLLCLLFGFFL